MVADLNNSYLLILFLPISEKKLALVDIAISDILY